MASMSENEGARAENTKMREDENAEFLKEEAVPLLREGRPSSHGMLSL